MKKILLIFILSFCFASQEVYTVVAIIEKQQGLSFSYNEEHYESLYFSEETALTVIFKNSKGEAIEIRKRQIKGIYDSDGDKIKLRDLRTSNPYLQNNNNIMKGKSFHFENNWSEESKMLFYQTEKISPEKALIYQALFTPIPFANIGYAYSNNWDKGIMLDCADLVSRISIFKGISDEDDGLVFIGMLGVVVSNVLKITECYRLAEKYNNNLYRNLFGDKRPDFSINFSIDNGAMLSMSIPIN